MNTSGTPNYFDLLDLPVSCAIDETQLEHNYRALQSRLHPDRYVDAAPAERLAVLQQASMLNDAHTTLKSPLRRARHLLQLQGIDPERHEQRQLAPTFLLQQMEQREALETLIANEDLDGLERLRASSQQQCAAVWHRFCVLIDDKRFEEAKVPFHELQFLHKLLDELADAEDRLIG